MTPTTYLIQHLCLPIMICGILLASSQAFANSSYQIDGKTAFKDIMKKEKLTPFQKEMAKICMNRECPAGAYGRVPASTQCKKAVQACLNEGRGIANN